MKKMQTPTFTLRKDHNGYRPVFAMGNTLGLCPHDCKFCSVKTGAKVPVEEIVARFDELFVLYAYVQALPPVGGDVIAIAQVSAQ